MFCYVLLCFAMTFPRHGRQPKCAGDVQDARAGGGRVGQPGWFDTAHRPPPTLKKGTDTQTGRPFKTYKNVYKTYKNIYKTYTNLYKTYKNIHKTYKNIYKTYKNIYKTY